MPRPSRGARGFLRLERNGDRVTEPSNVEPFETLVSVVFIEATLPPFVALPAYGRPDESVIETPVYRELEKKFVNVVDIHVRITL